MRVAKNDQPNEKAATHVLRHSGEKNSWSRKQKIIRKGVNVHEGEFNTIIAKSKITFQLHTPPLSFACFRRVDIPELELCL